MIALLKQLIALIQKLLAKDDTPAPVIDPPSTAQPAPVSSTPTTTPAPSSGVIPWISPPNWLGQWSGNIWQSVLNLCTDKTTGDIKLFVIYNIPGRDNGNYSAGGLTTAQGYWAWIGSIADAIGNSAAWVILEPDALALGRGLTPDLQDERISMLSGAVKALKAKPNIKVFADASMWVEPEKMAEELKKVGGIDGFSCNVSGYARTVDCQAWADQVSQLTGLGYIIDTSRNGFGNPHAPMWCNVTDTKVGSPAVITTYHPRCLAFVWAKVPGESDGLGINDDGTHPRTDVPKAGDPFPEYKEAIYSGDWTAFKAKYGV